MVIISLKYHSFKENKKTKNTFFKQNEVIEDFGHKFKIMEYSVFVLKLIIIYEMSYNFFSVYKNSDNKM